MDTGSTKDSDPSVEIVPDNGLDSPVHPEDRLNSQDGTHATEDDEPGRVSISLADAARMFQWAMNYTPDESGIDLIDVQWWFESGDGSVASANTPTPVDSQDRVDDEDEVDSTEDELDRG
ncbi:Protein of unknown function [Pyronema omphalodes CBS 100304]|uniref:Uncharacterized protein n=1 Tax=Pyronema omphalodes (strain CBS 100304) TaxID=1076935 RepID=U4LCF4_PYROM|nr:Protein of unknown function [Pyronema omphalodes CBS 100304]